MVFPVETEATRRTICLPQIMRLGVGPLEEHLGYSGLSSG